MIYLELLAAAARALTRNKMRSLLTVLGITIGTAAVICVVGIGNAGQARVEKQMKNLGDAFVWIESGGRAVNGVYTGAHSLPTLTVADALAIRSQISLIKLASPHVDDTAQVIFGNQNWFTQYRGVSPEYFDIKRGEIEEGEAFTEDDIARSADVCVIGHTIKVHLFNDASAVGKVMRVRDLPCRVIGSMKPKGLAMSGQDQDDTVIMPFTTVMKKIKGTTWLDDIVCSAVSQDVVKIAGKQAAALLRDRHHLRPEEDDDFNIHNPEDVIQVQLEASRTLSLLLIAVASVSLLVGGIGIMNVMLVSVTERTREIGVRIAIGATESAIRIQFLAESAMLSLIGGLAGVLLGVLGSTIISRTFKWDMAISPAGVLIGTLFSVLIGMFFGYYPAHKASRLDPIEALRYE